jgi:hypothetical protein
MRLLNPQQIKSLFRNAAAHFHDNGFVMQFIPIILVLLYATKQYAFSQISHSAVGKLFAVALVLYYTRMNKLYGLATAILVILYYQMTEHVETFDNNVVEDKDEKKEKQTVENDGVEDDGTNLPEPEPESMEESFVSGKEPSIITIDHFNDARDEFVKDKCKNGVLMYKMMPVRDEMADHVFSEIQFINDRKCNPCSATCDYNIVEAKMKTEESLVPKMSRLMFL